MGPTRSDKRNPRSQYDPQLLENWTVERLKQECRRKNIRFPANARRMALVRLLKTPAQSISESNAMSILGDVCAVDVDTEGSSITHAQYDGNSARSHDSTSPTPDVNNDQLDRQNRTLIDVVSSLTSTVQALQSNMKNLTHTVNGLVGERRINGNNAPQASAIDSRRMESNVLQDRPGTGIGDVIGGEFNLETAYRSFNNTMPSAAAGSEAQLSRMSTVVRTTHGFSAESLPFVESISPQLRKSIVAGNDINLAALLVPYYTGSGINEAYSSVNNDEKAPKHDSRINRNLSIGEFIQAFGIYKNVMCEVFPHRRKELDAYERDVIDMAYRYPGQGYYEYHKKFAAEAAAHLKFNNVVIDWSIRNNRLFCNIFSSARPIVCSNCNSPFHNTISCNQRMYNSQYFNKSRGSEQDLYGRERVFHMGREVCNNFNGMKGCSNVRCRNAHVCLNCKGDQSKMLCSKNEMQAPHKTGAMSQRKM